MTYLCEVSELMLEGVFGEFEGDAEDLRTQD